MLSARVSRNLSLSSSVCPAAGTTRPFQSNAIVAGPSAYGVARETPTKGRLSGRVAWDNGITGNVPRQGSVRFILQTKNYRWMCQSDAISKAASGGHPACAANAQDPGVAQVAVTDQGKLIVAATG